MEYQAEVLKYIAEIGSLLRLQEDAGTLLRRVSEAACKGLGFRCSVLYLSDGAGYFRARATYGISAEEVAYHEQHALPDALVVQLINDLYRLGPAYFIPAQASIWEDQDISEHFVVDTARVFLPTLPPREQDALWDPEDMLVVPLVNGDNILLGFLTPDSPLDGLRPTVETMTLLEVFANQAAVAIEGVRLYEEVRQSSEERKALIEIGRALSAPDALRDLQSVYQAIYEQVKRVMPTDVFFVARSVQSEQLCIDYLIDEEIVRPAVTLPVFTLQARSFLLQENQGWLFSSVEEYGQYMEERWLSGFASAEGYRAPQSLLLVSIGYAGDTIGLLSVLSYRSNAYTQRHLGMLQEIGVQAGIAITTARLNTELRTALRQAQESEQLKNHFLITASHELRTPLTAIQGYLELLSGFQRELDEDAKRRFINKARRACEELVLLLGNVMDISRVDQDTMALHVRCVQVSKAVQVILEIMEPTINREGREVDLEVPEELMIWADEARLRQILLNIVGNALKYTPAPSPLGIRVERMSRDVLRERLKDTVDGTLEAERAVSRSGHDEFALLSIRDWGPGIGKEDQERLFSKFVRLDHAINSLQQGSGLGLFLCRMLTEAMGGSIWVESTGIAGEGTKFLLAFPLYAE